VDSFFVRYRNTSILVAVLFAQVLALAVQVKRPTEGGSTRLLRLWVVNTVTPLEKGLVSSGHGVRGFWGNYIYLRGVRRENRELRQELEHMRVEQVRLNEDAAQAHRLQALFGFKEQFISSTVPAQVIGTSGSDLSRVFFIDKGANAGIKVDMAVITPDGIVGKILRVFNSSSQVLEISDASSGVGAILEKSRLQGILQGTAAGDVVMRYVMSDEKVEPGERVLTSGGDRIFPKGLPIGTVVQTTPGSDLFLNIRVKPSANLGRIEEVLVITTVVEKEPAVTEASGPIRAADILAERLPSVAKKAATEGGQPATPNAGSSAQNAAAVGKPPAPPNAATSSTPKPATAPTITKSATTAVATPKQPDRFSPPAVHPVSAVKAISDQPSAGDGTAVPPKPKPAANTKPGASTKPAGTPNAAAPVSETKPAEPPPSESSGGDVTR
jgi:rod shape-determining protein MreC